MSSETKQRKDLMDGTVKTLSKDSPEIKAMECSKVLCALLNQKDVYFWRSIETCNNPKQNVKNLKIRLPWLSPKGFEFNPDGEQKDWVKILDDLKIGDNDQSLFDLNENGKELCLCGHEIYHLYFIQSSEGVIAQIGCECIKRFAPEVLQKYEKEKKEKRKAAKRGHCDVCDKEVADIKKHPDSIMHKRFLEKQQAKQKKEQEAHFKELQNILERFLRRKVREKKKREEQDLFERTHRKCIGCPKMIPKDPEWKTRCLECYDRVQKKEGPQECIDCKIELPEDSPHWKKRCLRCYKTSKKNISS